MASTRWEYLTTSIDVTSWLGPKINPEQIGRELNRYGREGWELISVVDVSHTSGTTTGILAVFKRQVE